MKLLETNLPITSITVMVQKEVAERLTALPGTKQSGAITYSIYYYCIPENVISVPKECFLPIPEVDSSVIKLTKREEPPVILKNKELFFKLIKTSFSQRRKTLLNSLPNQKILPKETLAKILQTLEIKENARAEELSIEQFASIANEIEGNGEN